VTLLPKNPYIFALKLDFHPPSHMRLLFCTLFLILCSTGLFAQKPDLLLSNAELAELADPIMDGAPGQVKISRAFEFLQKGDVLVQKHDYVQAIRAYYQALQRFRKLDERAKIGQTLVKIGDVYAVGSYFKQAIESYRESLEFLRNSGQSTLLAETLEKMAGIQATYGFTKQSITFYKRSLDIKERLNDKPGVLFCQHMLAKLHFADKNHPQALEYNQKVLKSFQIEPSMRADASIWEIIILTFLNKIPEAEQSAERAKVIIEAQNNRSDRIRLLAAMSNLHLAQRDKTQAKILLDSAKAMVRGSRNPELVIPPLEQMAQIHENNGDYQEAYRAMSLIDQYKTSVRSQHIVNLSAEIRAANEGLLNEKEVQLLKMANQLSKAQFNEEKLARLALFRENRLKDADLSNHRLQVKVMEKDAQIQNDKLSQQEKSNENLRVQNQLKEKMLAEERRSEKILWMGLIALAALGGLIFYLYQKQGQKNEIIRKQSAELAVLNREIHHRVKNNLQVISSMLDLQSQTIPDEHAKVVIKEAILRVQSMAFIHQNLYRDEAVNIVNMNDYIKILCAHLFDTYNIRADKIQLHTEIEDLKLHTDTAVPLGLILNELISNALKYAFQGREAGNIWVVLAKYKEELLLQVKDDGVGLAPDFRPENTSSFGYEIIQAFAQKLRARLNIDGRQGADIRLLISKYKTA
jgi:two-component system, sensor histidine kinase PdtaS